MNTNRRTMVLATSILLATTICGCPLPVASLPAIVATVVDGIQIIDMIEAFVSRYFAARPDPEAQRKVDEAVAACRGTLNVALRSAQGADAADKDKVDAAFEEFKKAYLALVDLCKPYGVRQGSSSALKTAPRGSDQLVVPLPVAFRTGRP